MLASIQVYVVLFAKRKTAMTAAILIIANANILNIL